MSAHTSDPSVDPFLARFHVPHYEIREAEINEYLAALDSAPNEAAMQVFLEEHPRFLTQFVGGSWVIPRKRLGSEHETDFLIGDRDATGFIWHAVELERPQERLFTSKGDPTAALTHALRQISDWRTWLSRNRDYASRPRSESGLGLRDIEPELEGLIVLGRATDVRADTGERLRRLARDHRVKICTFDWLAEVARSKLPPPNPIADLLKSISDAPQPIAREAIHAVFGGISYASMELSAVRTLDWDFVSIPNAAGGEAEVLFDILRNLGRDKVINLGDWQDWSYRLSEMGIETNMTLLASERAPSEELISTLTKEDDGLWFTTRHSSSDLVRHRSDGEMHVLLYIPPSLHLDEAVNRTRTARSLLERHWERVSHI